MITRLTPWVVLPPIVSVPVSVVAPAIVNTSVLVAIPVTVIFPTVRTPEPEDVPLVRALPPVYVSDAPFRSRPTVRAY
jgi:hypothetical protein